MVVGLPKGLLFNNYGRLLEVFLQDLGVEYIVSPDTNREILDRGVNNCVDDACLPIKVFHGHVHWLKDKCDLIVATRIMKTGNREFICPKFCGLIEMLRNTIPELPELTEEPLNVSSDSEMLQWFLNFGRRLGFNKRSVIEAFRKAITAHKAVKLGYDDKKYKLKVALMGHPYNIYDTFCNMDVRRKLNLLEVGVVTEENIPREKVEEKVKTLYKKPFWNFAKNSFGASAELYDRGEIDGIIYISSFACGIDSIVIELIKEYIGDFPFMVLKIDEHTGEAGLETRIEAFCDMLERRKLNEDKRSAVGEYIHSS